MAIKRTNSQASSNPEQELNFAVNNGDLEALRAVMEKFGFKDEESVLRFALAVLSKSATRSLTITNQDGVRVSLNPSVELLTPVEAPAQK